MTAPDLPGPEGDDAESTDVDPPAPDEIEGWDDEAAQVAAAHLGFGDPDFDLRPVAAVAFDPDLPVAGDTACRSCGYNLRGLMPEGRCPECGHPVPLSLGSDLLRHADPGWIRSLRRGIHLVLTGILVMSATLIVVVSEAFTPMLRGASLAAGLSTMLTGFLAIILGGWQLTRPETPTSRIGQGRTVRVLIRVALVIAVLRTAALATLLCLPDLDPTVQLVLTLFRALGGILQVIGLVAGLFFLARLGTRMQSRAIGSLANFLMYALGASYALFHIATASVEAREGFFHRYENDLAGLLAAVSVFGLALFGLATVVLLFMTAARLGIHARHARALRVPRP